MFAIEYKDIHFMDYKVDKTDIDTFKKHALDMEMPDSFVLESMEGYFRIKQSTREFIVLRRKSYDLSIYKGYPTDEEIEMAIMIMYKIAFKSGFKVTLENKYSN
jgi:hypothetical protein